MKLNNTGLIVKSKTTEKFTIIPNSILTDQNLSLKSKGLLCILLSLPSDWAVYKTQLQQFSKDGRDATIAAFDELVEVGYITAIRRHNEKGHFIGFDYVVYNEIVAGAINNPIPENPKSENPKSENPKSDNPLLQSTNKQNTNKQSTNEQRTNITSIENSSIQKNENTGTSILGKIELQEFEINKTIKKNEMNNESKVELENSGSTKKNDVKNLICRRLNLTQEKFYILVENNFQDYMNKKLLVENQNLIDEFFELSK